MARIRVALVYFFVGSCVSLNGFLPASPWLGGVDFVVSFPTLLIVSIHSFPPVPIFFYVAQPPSAVGFSFFCNVPVRPWKQHSRGRLCYMPIFFISGWLVCWNTISA